MLEIVCFVFPAIGFCNSIVTRLKTLRTNAASQESRMIHGGVRLSRFMSFIRCMINASCFLGAYHHATFKSLWILSCCGCVIAGGVHFAYGVFNCKPKCRPPTIRGSKGSHPILYQWLLLIKNGMLLVLWSISWVFQYWNFVIKQSNNS